MIVRFEEAFAPFAEAAVARLSYLYPDRIFSVRGLSVVIEGEGDDVQVRRDVHYQLYREKILSDGMPLREMMYKALLT